MKEKKLLKVVPLDTEARHYIDSLAYIFPLQKMSLGWLKNHGF
jgi:hypothetical protein